LNNHDENAPSGPAPNEANPELAIGMGTAHASRPDSSNGGQGSQDGAPEGFDLNREDRTDVETPGDYLRKRHSSRVPNLNDLAALDAKLIEAFQEGDPKAAYEASKQIVDFARSALTELAKVRFEKNFGSEQCQRCEGLKAGPGVVATCLQVRLCYFKNFTADDVTPKQERALRSLHGS
jgi:hypothetical protein